MLSNVERKSGPVPRYRHSSFFLPRKNKRFQQFTVLEPNFYRWEMKAQQSIISQSRRPVRPARVQPALLQIEES